MKTTMIALSAAVLIAAAPAVFAKDVSSKTASVQHKVSKRHHPGVTNYTLQRETQVKGRTMGYPGAFGYAPGASPVERSLPDQAPGGAGATPGPGGGNTSVTTGQQAFGANGNPNLPALNLSGTGPSTSGGGAAGGGGGGGGGTGR